MNEEIFAWRDELINRVWLAARQECTEIGDPPEYLKHESLSDFPPGEFIARKGGLSIFSDSKLSQEALDEVIDLLDYCEIRIGYVALGPRLKKSTFGELKLGQEFYYNREYNQSPFTKIRVDNGDCIQCFGEDNGKLIRLTDSAQVEIFKGA